MSQPNQQSAAITDDVCARARALLELAGGNTTLHITFEEHEALVAQFEIPRTFKTGLLKGVREGSVLGITFDTGEVTLGIKPFRAQCVADVPREIDLWLNKRIGGEAEARAYLMVVRDRLTLLLKAKR